jgi:hypothetical protein
MHSLSAKIHLFSGQASTSDLLEQAKADGYDSELLTKPVHPADLLAKLHGAPVTALSCQP